MMLVFLASCGLCLIVMRGTKIAAKRIGLVDRPDGRRKIHAQPVPLAGGLTILMSAWAILGFGLLASENLRASLQEDGFRLVGLLLAAITICVIGVADDFGYLRGRHKLHGQVLAALVLVQFNWVVRSLSFFDGQIELGLLAVPFTVFWLLAAINSLNLIDGMDGLLGLVGLILCLGLAWMGALEAHWGMAYVALAMAGALLGFLRYNLPPASVFLGDAGSMLIGLVVGTLAIHGGTYADRPVPLIIPIAFLAVPFLDTSAAIIRRKMTGRSIYTTDRGHLHHCLLRQGYSPGEVLLWVSGFCLLSAGGGMAALILQQESIALLTILVVVSIPIVTGLFGHVEFSLLRDRCADLAWSLLRRPAQAGARQKAVRLQGTVDWEELWGNLIAGARYLNLVSIRLNVNAPALHEAYHARWDSAHRNGDDAPIWRAEIPLMLAEQVLGRIEVVGHPDHEPVREKMDMLLKLVEYFETEAFDLVHNRSRPSAVQTPVASEELEVNRGEKVSTQTELRATAR